MSAPGESKACSTSCGAKLGFRRQNASAVHHLFLFHDGVLESQYSRLSSLRETAAGGGHSRTAAHRHPHTCVLSSESPQAEHCIPSSELSPAVVGRRRGQLELPSFLSAAGCLTVVLSLPGPLWVRTLLYPTHPASPTCLPFKIRMCMKTPTCLVTLTKFVRHPLKNVTGQAQSVIRNLKSVIQKKKPRQSGSDETVGSRVSSTKGLSGTTATRQHWKHTPATRNLAPLLLTRDWLRRSTVSSSGGNRAWGYDRRETRSVEQVAGSLHLVCQGCHRLALRDRTRTGLNLSRKRSG